MNPILRLYPRTWRERYGEELERLLEDVPSGVMGTIDLARGALDARLHPSLVPQAAGGGPAPFSGDLPAVRRRFPLGAFLGTFAAGLFLLSGAIIAVQLWLPYIIGYQLANAFLSIASLTLGLTVMATTGRGIIAKLAGVAYLAGVIFLTWDQAWVPAVMSLMGGSALLALGSLLERRPARWIGLLTLALAVTAWLGYHAENDLLLGLIVGSFAVVATGLARSGGNSLRPIFGGLAITGIVAVLIIGGTLAMSTAKVHDGLSVQCGSVETSSCIAAVDELTAKVRALRPADRIVYAHVEGRRATICTEPPRMADGSRGLYDADSIDGIGDDPTLGLWAGMSVAPDGDLEHYTEACWHLT